MYPKVVSLEEDMRRVEWPMPKKVATFSEVKMTNVSLSTTKKKPLRLPLFRNKTKISPNRSTERSYQTNSETCLRSFRISAWIELSGGGGIVYKKWFQRDIEDNFNLSEGSFSGVSKRDSQPAFCIGSHERTNRSCEDAD